jgi:hypothetical protein
MRFKKLIYRNFFGEYNILVTISDDGKTPHRDTLIPDHEIYKSHIWIHDNIVKKNHTGKEIFILDSIVSDDELKRVLGIVL